MQRFEAAPWPVSLKVLSMIGAVVLAGAAIVLARVVPYGALPPVARWFGTFLPVVPAAILLGALLFVVKGYEFDEDELYVERLLWRTPLGLSGLARAWHDPSAMRRSIRLFGNGGLFAVTGVFRNARLGNYRAFVTDPKKTVVLKYESRVVVVSPADPRALLEHLKTVSPATAVSEPPVVP